MGGGGGGGGGGGDDINLLLQKCKGEEAILKWKRILISPQFLLDFMTHAYQMDKSSLK